MKIKILLCFSVYSIVCFLLLSCTSKKGNNDDIIQFKISTSYLEKEIWLEEIAEKTAQI